MGQNENQIKIAFLNSAQSWGGLEMNHYKSAAWMKERGHDVVGIGVQGSKFFEKMTSLTEVISIKEPSKYFALKNGFTLKKILVEKNISHLFIRDKKDFSAVYWAKKMGWPGKVFYFMGMQLGTDKKSWVHTQRFSTFDLWICPLPWLAKQVSEKTNFPNNKIREIKSGINPEKIRSSRTKEQARAQFSLDNKKLQIGLIGRIDRLKGHLKLLKAAEQIDEQKLQIVFMGAKTQGHTNAFENNMQVWIKENNFEDKVKFLPFSEHVADFYKAMDIIVMATPNETYGMVTIEALIAGNIIVGANGGGTPELLEQGRLGYLFDPNSVEELSKTLIKAITNGNKVSEKQRVEIEQEYHYGLECSKIEDCLKKV